MEYREITAISRDKKQKIYRNIRYLFGLNADIRRNMRETGKINKKKLRLSTTCLAAGDALLLSHCQLSPQ